MALASTAYSGANMGQSGAPTLLFWRLDVVRCHGTIYLRGKLSWEFLDMIRLKCVDSFFGDFLCYWVERFLSGFCSESGNACYFCLVGSKWSASHSHLAFAEEWKSSERRFNAWIISPRLIFLQPLSAFPRCSE